MCYPPLTVKTMGNQVIRMDKTADVRGAHVPEHISWFKCSQLCVFAGNRQFGAEQFFSPEIMISGSGRSDDRLNITESNGIHPLCRKSEK